MDKFIIKEIKKKITIKQVGSPGPKGEDGDAGLSATIAVGSVTSGNIPSVTNVGTENDAIFDFVLAKGAKGDNGDSSTLQNIGDGVGVWKDTVGSIASLKTIRTGSDILLINDNEDDNTIDFNINLRELNNVISNNLTGINEELTLIEEHLNSLDLDVDTINTSIGNINTQIGNINTTLTSHGNSITSLNTQVGTNTTNISTNTTNIATNTSAITSINTQITNINNSITAINSKLVPIGGTTGQVLTKKSNTDNDLEWKDAGGVDENIFTAYNMATTTGFVNNNNSFIGVGIQSVYNNGPADSPVPAWTVPKYDGRARNLFRVTDNPTSTSTTSYHSPVFTRYIGTTAFGGLSGKFDFVFETNADPLFKCFIGEISTFIGVPSLSSGPNGLTNCIGFGFDSGDTIFNIYMNNASGSPVKIPVSSFTGNLIATDYQARVTKNPYLVSYVVNAGGTLITFTFTHLISGRTGKYVINNPTKLPASNIPLRPMFNVTSGTAGLAQMDGIAIYGYSLTKPYR